MIRRPPGSTRTDTLLPYTTLFRSRRRLRRLALADFDEVAVHAVVADLEGGNASGFALALLELDEAPVGVGPEPAQFVKFAVVTVGDDAAVVDNQRRLPAHGGGAQVRLTTGVTQSGSPQLMHVRIPIRKDRTD